MIFAWTRLRMSVMARCAATPRICDRPKLVTAWTTVAAPAAIAIGISSSTRPLPITSSITYLDSSGSTMPASRLNIIKVRPIVSRRRCTHTQLAELAPRCLGIDFLLGRAWPRGGSHRSRAGGPFRPPHARGAGSH